MIDDENNNENNENNDNDNDINEHLIDNRSTNKSLLETEQWKYRTKDKFKKEKDVNIHILSI